MSAGIAIDERQDAFAANLDRAGLFGTLDLEGHEEIVHCADRGSGLRAIIAIHSTALGPALGGVRMRPYQSEHDALDDVLRLSRAMTYKASLAGIDYGGGKSVIIGDPAQRTEALIRMFARFVESLGGRYITAEDVGLAPGDLDLVRSETRWVAGVSPMWGGLGSPSEATAAGVLAAMRAVAERVFRTRSLDGMRVAVMGVGKVGAKLTELLVSEGCRVTIADVDASAAASIAKRHHVALASPARIHTVECDVFAPCALGGILSSSTVPQLRCAAVVGSANNQLRDPAAVARLADRDVVYLPDYAANAGGLIQVAAELRGLAPAVVPGLVARIEDTCRALLAESDSTGITPSDAADRLAARRLREVGSLKTLHGASWRFRCDRSPTRWG